MQYIRNQQFIYLHIKSCPYFKLIKYSGIRMSTITITYGESVENHVGNQQIGDIADEGFSTKKLKEIHKLLKNTYKCRLINLNKLLPETYTEKKKVKSASILIVKDFVNGFFAYADNIDNTDNQTTIIFEKLKKLKWDKKVKMRGRVVNKHARYNVCFGDFNQVPDYENGKGRVYNFKKQPELGAIRNYLKELLGLDKQLNAEGNYYYDTDKCYIGFHGDTERKIVVGLRFGEPFPLYYRWYNKNKPITEPYKINLKSGDLYIMSEKASGFDWKRSSITTLRHAAGNLENYSK